MCHVCFVSFYWCSSYFRLKQTLSRQNCRRRQKNVAGWQLADKTSASGWPPVLKPDLHVCVYPFTTLLRPHGHQRLQELLGNQRAAWYAEYTPLVKDSSQLNENILGRII